MREELPREEALLEEALREEAPREDRDPAELLLPLADLDVALLLEPLLLLELPVDPLFDLLLPDRAFADDDRAPDEREELLFLDLPLDFDGMGISFSVYSCAMNTFAPQDANACSNCWPIPAASLCSSWPMCG